jgi:hypothetical protein
MASRRQFDRDGVPSTRDEHYAPTMTAADLVSENPR